MYPFTYHQPDTARKAAGLAEKSEDFRYLAGGQTLLPTMKQRLSAPANLIDLTKLDELRGIEVKARSVTIGAMTKHAEVANSKEVQEAIPALAELASWIGDPAVRSRGTIGGSIANNDPAADYPAACLGLGATITTNKRSIEADDFFKGLFETALEEGEMITKVTFPIPQKAGYEKFRHPASRFALVGVFVARRADGVRVAVTGAGSEGVFRAANLEAALTAKFASKSLEGLKTSADKLNSDIHADAEYRAHLIPVLARRAVDKAK